MCLLVQERLKQQQKSIKEQICWITYSKHATTILNRKTSNIATT